MRVFEQLANGSYHTNAVFDINRDIHWPSFVLVSETLPFTESSNVTDFVLVFNLARLQIEPDSSERLCFNNVARGNVG